ncbi:hypothetical protein RB200_28765 [Streptomyces sp. PmtG]
MTPRGADHEILMIALDHAWRWYENRRGRAYQVLNALLVFLAVTATAYAAAVTADMHGPAGVMCVVAAVIIVGAHAESMRLQASAHLAEEAIRKLQEGLAATLDIDALRLVEREHALHSTQPVTERVLVCLGVVISLGGAVYTWVATP